MRNLKKVLALVLVLALSLTMFAGAIETVLPYDDLDELTAEQLDALKLLYALGVIKGDDENSVNPTDTLTRGELTAILYRLYTGDAEEQYISTYSTDCPYFDDVEDGQWYVPYINWAYIKGVVAGYGDGNFGPRDNVDGVQAATMLARLVGYEIGSENWELVARRYALELGLDDGVSSKDLFGTDLSRGDMIVMVANVLDCYEAGTEDNENRVTLAEKIFDLEIIHGAILVGADKLGSTDYSVFAFKDEIAGNVKYFITDLLSIEEKPTVDEIGQKYTLYVAKTTEVNGYKVLYAAYEEEEGAYYQTVTGTVDDGKLNVKDADKDDYLLKLLDKHVIAYINGSVVANNAADAFAAFKASYGLKNSAAYKLIDNDGDGLYEYIFVERLTLAAMNTTEIVANVVAYNNITGAYTLSDGKEYVPGQYWGVDKDNKITNNVVNAVDAIRAAIGTGNFTASSVQYKFTIENGKYIMLAEVCDETYFAGDYVLAMNSVGNSTYKGMRYVEFLTEDNTALYAYVSKINHNDVRNWNGANDNNPTTAYTNELYYINAYGDDTVELFTPDYVNSNYVNDYVDGNNQSVVTVDMTSKFTAVEAVGNVYTHIDAVVGEKGGIVPEIPFDANKYYYLYDEATGKYNPVIFTKSTYSGYFAKLAAGESDTVKAAEEALADAEAFVAKAQELYTLVDTWAAAKTANGFNSTPSADELSAYNALNALWTECGFSNLAFYVDNITDADTLATKVAAFDNDVKASLDERIATAEKNLADAIAAVEVGSDVYYVSAWGRDPVEVAVSIAADYNTDELQIFKVYGTWYVQNYGDLSVDGYTVYFTVDGATYEVEYDNGAFYAITRNAAGEEVSRAIFSVGSADASVINDSIKNVIAGFDSDDTGEDFVYDNAQALNTSKGVVFAYGQYPVDGAYRWRAYNFDEFNVNFFGRGGEDDDNGWMETEDQMIYTISNGQYYVKAAKVTVMAAADVADRYQYDILPMGWMVKNSMLFIYGNDLGTITSEGQTVQAILPNGTTRSVFIPYGMLFTGRPNDTRYGNVYYAVLDENGNVISVEYICNVFNVFDGVAGDELLQLTGDTYLDYAADGTVTIQGKLGITYTSKIDVDNTFFIINNEFVSSADFAKYLDEHANETFEIWVDAYGYNYAVID